MFTYLYIMKLIKLSQGYFTKVDNEDYDWLMKYKWWLQIGKSNFYAIGWVEGREVKMHRLILRLTDPSIYTDHIDMNGLNNQRSNLRKCTHSENARNRNSRGVSRYLGVYPSKRITIKDKWSAKIVANNKIIYLGVFDTEEEAAIARDKMAIKLHGKFAKLNIL